MKGIGLLIIVAAIAVLNACAPSEEEIQRLVVAEIAKLELPQGPQGKRGDIGPQGVAGVQGEVGPPGPSGERGERGDVGPQGISGIQGEIGPPGPSGEREERGDVGPQGVAGIQGEVGPPGPQGERGEAGPQGVAGIQGEVGPPGPQDERGNPGITSDGSLTVQRLIIQEQGNSPGYVVIDKKDDLSFAISLYRNLEELDDDRPYTRLELGSTRGMVYHHWQGGEWHATCFRPSIALPKIC